MLAPNFPGTSCVAGSDDAEEYMIQKHIGRMG